MKNFLALGIITAFSLSALAGERPHIVEVGGLFYSYDYKEVLPPPAKSNESGLLPGFYLGYAYRGVDLPLFGKLNIEYTTSQTTYDGALQSPDGAIIIPYTGTTKNILKRVELVGGYNFNLAKGKIFLTPYTGYGYRFWRRTLGGVGGYEEDYYWSYIPIGVRTDYHFGEKWSTSADVALRIMFGSGLDVKDNSIGNPTLDIGDKLGYKISFPTSYYIGEGWSLVLEPWYESSAIAESPMVVIDPIAGIGTREPDSNTNIFGISAGVRFAF